MSFNPKFLGRYHVPSRIDARREAFLRGDPGVRLSLDPVEFFSRLGFDTDAVPEAVEQIRRDRDRLIDEARD